MLVECPSVGVLAVIPGIPDVTSRESRRRYSVPPDSPHLCKRAAARQPQRMKRVGRSRSSAAPHDPARFPARCNPEATRSALRFQAAGPALDRLAAQKCTVFAQYIIYAGPRLSEARRRGDGPGTLAGLFAVSVNQGVLGKGCDGQPEPAPTKARESPGRSRRARPLGPRAPWPEEELPALAHPCYTRVTYAVHARSPSDTQRSSR
jgi:hypothetical protein